MEKIQIEFKVNGIDLIEKHLYRFDNIPPTAEYNFQVNSQTIFTKEPLSLIVTFTSIELSMVGNVEPLAKFLIGMGFQVLNPEVIFKEEQPSTKVVWPPEIDNYFKSIAISTARGILFSELRGTPLHNAILPVIKMDTFKPIEGNLIEPKNIKDRKTH